jgi:hypothetical protein
MMRREALPARLDPIVTPSVVIFRYGSFSGLQFFKTTLPCRMLRHD